MKAVKILSVTIALLASISFANGQDYKIQFKTMVTDKDTAGQRKLLNEWQSKQPDDAELYVAQFNYHFTKSKKELLNLGNTDPGNEALVITNPGDKKPVAYLSSNGIYYDKSEIDKAMASINTGIEKFPNRLDMRFGKIYVLGVLKDYDAFTSEIIKAINYSDVNHNAWTWADNKPVADPLKVMLSSIQSYSVQLYQSGDAQIRYMKEVAETVLRYYPNDVENLSNLAITNIIQKDYDAALKPLLKATQITPTDAIVLNNIAYCYEQKQDKANAIKYYELTLKYGGEKAKKKAGEKLDMLKSN